MRLMMTELQAIQRGPGILKPFTPDVRKAPPEEPVCWCAGVTKGRILLAMDAGARSLEAIKAATGACTEGRCKETSPRGR